VVESEDRVKAGLLSEVVGVCVERSEFACAEEVRSFLFFFPPHFIIFVDVNDSYSI
jgi:hypothetical protein